MIITPYGPKSPELITKALDTYEAVQELMPLLSEAGVLNLYIAPVGSHHRTICTRDQIRISDLLEKLRTA